MFLKIPKSDQASHSIPKPDHAAHKIDHKFVKSFKVADVKSKTPTPTIEKLCKPNFNVSTAFQTLVLKYRSVERTFSSN